MFLVEMAWKTKLTQGFIFQGPDSAKPKGVGTNTLQILKRKIPSSWKRFTMCTEIKTHKELEKTNLR